MCMSFWNKTNWTAHGHSDSKGQEAGTEPVLLLTKLTAFQLSGGILPLYLAVSTNWRKMFFGIWVITNDEFTMGRRKG